MSTNGGVANQVLGGYWIRGNAIDGTNVYFQPYGSWNVLRYNLGSGAVISLITGNTGDVGLFLDDNNVYCNTGGNIQKVSKNGGIVKTLVNSTNAVGGVSDGVNVYFVDNGAIQFIPVTGGTITTLVAPGSFGGLAVDSTHLYYIDGSGPAGAAKILKIPLPVTKVNQTAPR